MISENILIQTAKTNPNMVRQIWRTRLLPSRTFANVKLNIVLPPAEYTPLYIKLSQKTTELNKLGMDTLAVAAALKVDVRTVRRALRYKAKR